MGQFRHSDNAAMIGLCQKCPASVKDCQLATSWYWLQRWRKRAKHQLRAQPLCEMCLTRGEVTAACICDHVEPHGSDWNRFLAHSARAITLAHRAPLINTTPRGVTCGETGIVANTRPDAASPSREKTFDAKSLPT